MKIKEVYSGKGQLPAPAKKLQGQTPKSLTPLAPSGMLHSHGADEEIILLCFTCRKPIWVIYPVKILSQFSTEQRPAKPIGHSQALDNKGKKGDFSCPLCKGTYAKYNTSLGTAQYMTSKGLV